MQQQDLSEALLIYDDINRKGFEGDLVLNGLAEFIRNLLVCKDEKVASLLDAVESFRERYVSMGKKVDAVYLVSALNVLNDAEINYKSARNKRLHVELALIKLCYLAQAMQGLAGTTGEKKRPAELLRPVSFRNIPAMEPVAKRTAKLMIETPVEAPVEPGIPKEPATTTPGMIPGSVAGSSSSLSRIRQQIADRARDKEPGSSRALEIEPLIRAWQQYADSLRENRNPAVQSLELARLRIIDAQTFEVSANNNLEQRFIEQEKRGLSDHLQQVFANKAISFTVIVEEKTQPEVPAERPLNKREQFMQIMEQYPLVRELKDRLRLELDY
jgi:DNA polymerase-3 subunit gamma/tau